jgi:hypothetical protein
MSGLMMSSTGRAFPDVSMATSAYPSPLREETGAGLLPL